MFSFKLNYNNPEENATPLFNGNIATTNWRTANDGVLRKYSYDYDQLNRLKYAHYQKPGITAQRPGSYDESLTPQLRKVFLEKLRKCLPTLRNIFTFKCFIV